MRPLRRCFIAIFMNKNCLFSQTLAFRNPLKCPFSTALKTYSDDARVFFASGKIDVKGWNLTATKQAPQVTILLSPTSGWPTMVRTTSSSRSFCCFCSFLTMRSKVGDQSVTNNAKRQVGVFHDDLADLGPVFGLLGHRAVLKGAVALGGFHQGFGQFHTDGHGNLLRRQLDLVAIELPVGSHQSIAERLRLGDEHSVKRVTMVERKLAQATGIFCSERQRFDPRG